MSQAVTQLLSTPLGMRVDLENQAVWLNRVLYWYRKDIEQSGQGILDFVIAHVEAADVKQVLRQHQDQLELHFMDYDWSLNAS
jgi:hypothetical protein